VGAGAGVRGGATRHNVVVILALAGHITTAWGIPLPSRPPLAAKDTRIPFPCMNHPCGCQTAERCWQSCCCFTPAERLAWARDHNVSPPSYAVLSDQGW